MPQHSNILDASSLCTKCMLVKCRLKLDFLLDMYWQILHNILTSPLLPTMNSYKPGGTSEMEFNPLLFPFAPELLTGFTTGFNELEKFVLNERLVMSGEILPLRFPGDNIFAQINFKF